MKIVAHHKRLIVFTGYALLIFFILNLSLFIFPGFAYCEEYLSTSTSPDYSIYDKNNFFNEPNQAVSESNNSFYPILITSIIIFGILIFAMWQTLKSRGRINKY